MLVLPWSSQPQHGTHRDHISVQVDGAHPSQPSQAGDPIEVTVCCSLLRALQCLVRRSNCHCHSDCHVVSILFPRLGLSPQTSFHFHTHTILLVNFIYLSSLSLSLLFPSNWNLQPGKYGSSFYFQSHASLSLNIESLPSFIFFPFVGSYPNSMLPLRP